MGKHFHFKLVLVIGSIFVLFAASIFLISERVIMTGFRAVEKQDYETRMDVLNNAIKAEKDYLKGQNSDWSAWDDPYDFITKNDAISIEKWNSDISEDMLSNLKIDFFVVLDRKYKISYILAYDKEGKEISENVDPELQKQVIEASKYFENNKKSETDSQEFFFPLTKEAALTSISYVLKSDGSGPPAGYMLMGEVFNQDKVKVLSEKNSLNLTITDFTFFEQENKNLTGELKNNSVAYDYPTAQKANGYLLLSDVDKNPISAIKSSFDRKVNQTAVSSRNYYLIEIYIIAFIALLVAVFIFNRLAISRRKQFEGETKYQLLFNENVMPLFLIKLDKKWSFKEIVEANNAAKNLYDLDHTDHYKAHPINILYGVGEAVIKDFVTTLANVGLSVTQGDLEIGQKKLTVEIIGRLFDIEQQKYLLLSIKDLSERVQYERKLEDYASNLKKFQLAVENASDLITITDIDGVIIYANQSVETISGFKMEEVIGKKAGSKDLWGGLMETEFYTQMWQTIKKNKTNYSGELKNKRKDGEEYDAAVSISPILDEKGEVIFFVGIERDITKAKEVDRAKTEFVSLASHQLRTPLSSVNWYTEMLLNKDAGIINKTQEEYLNEIYKGNKRMVALVNALLNVSRIDLGTFEVEPELINIAEVSKDVLGEMKQLINEKQINIIEEYENLPKINLDPKLTEIILQNLITNAVKYTSGKGNVIVAIKKEGENIKIEVSDTGYGIPIDQQEKIFTKLFRADNIRAMDTEGNGLGLYIVKSIVESAKGTITFTSEENKGTTFTVTLPLEGMKQKAGAKPLE